MSPDRWKDLLEIVGRALELPEGERDGYLAEACNGDSDLLDEARRLISASPPSQFIAPPPSTNSVSESRADLTGDNLGDFRLLEIIGRGGMGIVYRAKQISTGQLVAVKVLSLANATDELIARFRNEARVVATLDHPGIVPLITFGEEQSCLYFAMKLVDGLSLGELLLLQRSGRELPPGTPDFSESRTCASFVRDVARALEYAHDQGVLHRDVKPSNILLEPSGVARLADFGLARISDQETITKTGQVRGTPNYMSPEQAQAMQLNIDARTDIYSLGVVLYELLSLRLPHEGENSDQVYYGVLNLPPVHLGKRVSDVPEQLVTICMKAVRRRREERYASAGDLADDLDRYLKQEPIAATPQHLTGRIRDRLHDRRLLVKAIPLALGIGVLSASGVSMGLNWFADEARQEQSWPKLDFDLLDAGAQVEVHARHFLDGQFQIPSTQLGYATGGNFTGRFPLDDGNYLILFKDQSGATAEAFREVKQGAVSKGILRLTNPATLTTGVVDVDQVGPGAPATISLLDEAAITNAQFQKFVDLSGYVSDNWAKPFGFWETKPQQNWDVLPVNLISWYDARAYAEWHGKRLPFRSEWQALLDAQAEQWDAALAENKFVVGWPNYAEQDTPQRSREELAFAGQASESKGSSLPAYLAYAKPARINEHHELGIHHPIGNLSEWLNDPPSGPFLMPGAFQLWGEAWHGFGTLGQGPELLQGLGTINQTLSANPRISPGLMPSADIGFRCAKSLSLRTP